MEYDQEADFTKALDNFQTPGRHRKDAVTYAVTTYIKPWQVSNPELLFINYY